MTSKRRATRAGQMGQVVPIAALSVVVLLAITALAVDLSIQTKSRRELQNTSDAAALAGARVLPTSPSSQDQSDAVNAALTTVGANLSLPSGWAGNNPVSTCQGGKGKCANVSYTSGTDHYTVEVNTPPTQTSNATYQDTHFVEVIVHRTSNTFLATLMGFGSGTQGANSIAVHNGPNPPFGFALYAKVFVSGGNQGESVAGDVYAGQYINPQSNGQADFCVGKDTNGSATIFLGAPQYTGGGNPPPTVQYGQKPNGADPDTVHLVGTCSSVSGANEVAQEAALGCPSSFTGLLGFTFTYDINYTKMCVISPGLGQPVMPPPQTGPFYTLDGSGLGANQSVLKLTTAQPNLPNGSGVYKIIHNPSCVNTCYDVDFNSLTHSYSGVTFWLEKGATIGFEKGANVTLTPFVPAIPVGNDGKFLIYSDYDSAYTPSVSEVDNATTVTLGTGPATDCANSHGGTIYLPFGAFNVTSNALLSVSGQAIVDKWNVQSGNHTNPAVTFNGCNTAAAQEILQLVQ